MNKNFQRHRGRGGRWSTGNIRRIACRSSGRQGAAAAVRFPYLLDFRKRTLARQDHPLTSQFPGEGNARRAADGHLGGGVDRKIRRQPAHQPSDPHVLHDHRVGAGGDDRAQMRFGLGQFGLEHQGVERDISLDPAPMEKRHQPRQIGDGEIVGPHPGIEFVEAEINGIRAVFDGGFGARPIPGGREQFGQNHAGAGGRQRRSPGSGRTRNGGGFNHGQTIAVESGARKLESEMPGGPRVTAANRCHCHAGQR